MQNEKAALEVQRWFKKRVTYEGEKYTVDLEQAAAIADTSKNTIVVARAGSGKTRTIVAKIVYLVAECGIKPEEIMAFVFNANAAAEINARLSKMLVDGKPVTQDAKIASTFHAFSRKIVYDVYGGKDKCGKILASEKDDFVETIVAGMIRKEKTPTEMVALSRRMTTFINRAQQMFLAGEHTLSESIKKRMRAADASDDEKRFILFGEKCYKKYHAKLLSKQTEYGTDFNLIVAWAGKLIANGSEEARELLSNKKFLLIDEYQDFSQLFLSVVMAIRTCAKEARLFVVGDDWQAINRFAGSDVEYFKNFEKFFPEDVRRLAISTNYRCNYMIVDTARKFMKKAMGEKGEFRAFSRRAGSVIVVDPRQTELFQIIKREKRAKEILILHRNNETHMAEGSLMQVGRTLRKEVVKRKIMTREEFDAKVKLMTMHKSKGLEAEVVIILEADEGVIPKAHPDTSLYAIFGETEEVAMDDQKRLFYVAMTRAKKRLYIMHDKTAGEGFMKYLGRGVEKWED